MTSVKQSVRVLPGHRIEIIAPELAEGEMVDVVVLPRPVAVQTGKSAITLIDSLASGPRAFATWEDYEQHLRREKDAWER